MAQEKKLLNEARISDGVIRPRSWISSSVEVVIEPELCIDYLSIIIK